MGARFASTACMKAVVAIALGICALLLCLCGYEAFAVMRARARTPALLETVKARPLTLAMVGDRRLAMLLKVEDPGFFHHHGVDFTTPGQGATTLTQGLVKRLYFKRFRPGFAKIEQSLIARYALDPMVSKRDQLEIALNYASFGHVGGRDVIGFPAAAETYFHKPFGQLTDRDISRWWRC